MVKREMKVCGNVEKYYFFMFFSFRLLSSTGNRISNNK